ncbi:MAG: hypothetical protein K2N28_02985, partial [Muribaculaceae bacterium]|nr:hypothetical protein [Muribaculaceae bacterium]
LSASLGFFKINFPLSYFAAANLEFIGTLSWLVETWKISIIVKNEATVDALVDMYIPPSSTCEC